MLSDASVSGDSGSLVDSGTASDASADGSSASDAGLTSDAGPASNANAAGAWTFTNTMGTGGTCGFEFTGTATGTAVGGTTHQFTLVMDTSAHSFECTLGANNSFSCSDYTNMSGASMCNGLDIVGAVSGTMTPGAGAVKATVTIQATVERHIGGPQCSVPSECMGPSSADATVL